MITMLGLFIVVTYVEQRLIVLPNTAGKKELYGSNPCFNSDFKACTSSRGILDKCFHIKLKLYNEEGIIT